MHCELQDALMNWGCIHNCLYIVSISMHVYNKSYLKIFALCALAIITYKYLKGLSQERDLAFATCMVSSRPHRGRDQFLNFLGALDFIMQKVYFSRLM